MDWINARIPNHEKKLQRKVYVRAKIQDKEDESLFVTLSSGSQSFSPQGNGNYRAERNQYRAESQHLQIYNSVG